MGSERMTPKAAYDLQLWSLEEESPNARSYVLPYDELSDQAKDVYATEAYIMNHTPVAAESEGEQ